MAFEFKTTSKGSDTYIIACVGRLDTETSPGLEKEVKQLLQKAPKMLALDMERLDYMSSAGVRVLFLAQKGMKANGGKLGLMNIQPAIRKVLEIINALPNQKIFKDMGELDRYLDAIQRKVRGEDD
jgi:anti-sigma B factor antagonist